MLCASARARYGRPPGRRTRGSTRRAWSAPARRDCTSRNHRDDSGWRRAARSAARRRRTLLNVRERPRRGVRASWPDLPELVTQRLPRAREARLHGADSDAEGVGDFFVAQTVNLTQHDDRALVERQSIERRPQTIRELFAGVGAIGRRVVAGLAQIAMHRDVLIQGHLVGLVPPPPPTLAVARLIDDDAVDPRFERGLSAEVMDGAEDTEEDFLGEIQRFVAVAQQVEGELIDHPFVTGD